MTAKAETLSFECAYCHAAIERYGYMCPCETAQQRVKKHMGAEIVIWHTHQIATVELLPVSQ